MVRTDPTKGDGTNGFFVAYFKREGQGGGGDRLQLLQQQEEEEEVIKTATSGGEEDKDRLKKQERNRRRKEKIKRKKRGRNQVGLEGQQEPEKPHETTVVVAEEQIAEAAREVASPITARAKKKVKKSR